MNMPNDNNDAAKKPGILDMAVNQETFKVIFDWKDRIERIFTILPFQDFIPIWLLYERSLHTSQDKVYLREISEVLNMPMRRVSALARSMQDRGLVDWKHDGSGEDGTYLQIHEDVLNSVLMQKNHLNDLLERVINTFGKEEFLMLILTLSRIEKIIDQELKEE
ncbi:MAG: hypothetical protein ACSW8A_03245 [Lachnospiraceae bacterium]